MRFFNGKPLDKRPVGAASNVDDLMIDSDEDSCEEDENGQDYDPDYGYEDGDGDDSDEDESDDDDSDDESEDDSDDSGSQEEEGSDESSSCSSSELPGTRPGQASGGGGGCARSVVGSIVGSIVDGHGNGNNNCDAMSVVYAAHDEAANLKKESMHDFQRVQRWRAAVLIMLVLAGATMSTLSYFLLANQEYDDFTTAYDNYAASMRDVFLGRMRNVDYAIRGTSETITTQALQQQQQQEGSSNNDNSNITTTFPFVTLPMFEVQGEQYRRQSGIEAFLFTPFVTLPQQQPWEEYAQEHPEWLEWGREYSLMNTEIAIRPPYLPGQVNPTIYQYAHNDFTSKVPAVATSTTTTTNDEESSLFAPIWLTSPPPFHPDYVNYNMLSEPVLAPILASLLQQQPEHERSSSTSTRRVVASGGTDLAAAPPSALSSSTIMESSTFTPVFNLTHLSIGRLDNHYDVHFPYTVEAAAAAANAGDDSNTTSRSFDMDYTSSDTAATTTTTTTMRTGFEHPHSLVIRPVYEQIHDPTSRIVGLVHAILAWDVYLVDLLASDLVIPKNGFRGVLRNSCGQSFTYALDGHSATYLGEGSLQEEKWNDMEVKIPISSATQAEGDSSIAGSSSTDSDGHCEYTFSIYPSSDLHNLWNSKLAWVIPWCVAGTFLILALTFFMYDRFVRRRNEKVVNAAARSTKLVSSLFPSTVRDRLLAEQEHAEQREQGTKSRLKNFLAGDGSAACDLEETDDLMYKTKPIADLFPETTILFGDIAGFTAWSSAREPSQVFILLETVYRAFDMTAKRRRIFKVETVGDCYVAAAGLPEPRKDHAVAMARFAQDCMLKMQTLTRKLEVTLGPDTADLTMRMGMHSGPVTAGVLRGERSRFQLFGDTMNTASRMESTGLRDKIQLSQETADLLATAGKTRWIYPREDVVVAKGKGEMKTYWLDIDPNDLGVGLVSNHTSTYFDETNGDGSSSDGSFGSETSSSEDGQLGAQPAVSAKLSRLIDWNVDILLRLLKSIVARRQALGNSRGASMPNEDFSRRENVTVLDEVREIITLPAYDHAMAKTQVDPSSIELDAATESQLYEYVSAIASMYRENPFHNFEHASHVTMSVVKLLSRIVAPSDLDFESSAARNQTLHDHTYGITSDPLTQFACVLSALIHDVDHTGVPNSQLIKENPEFARMYKDRSVAEQNSVDVAWDLLFDDCYADLRATIYTTDDELQRFRQLVVNSVMATDIMDKELKELRNGRWQNAFSESPSLNEDVYTTVNRKATIVIEHLIQASDVAHTMQHWHIYRKWNTRLFEEMYKAYRDGRAEKNPADFWYQGEIGFFDFYIIPLAKKLKECGVFGVSSDEYLNYAERNRQEWELRGQEVVSELVETFVAKDLNKSFNRTSSIRSMSLSKTVSTRSLLSQCKGGESMRSMSIGTKTDESIRSTSLVKNESMRSMSMGAKTESNRSMLLGKSESVRSMSMSLSLSLAGTRTDSGRSVSFVTSEPVRSIPLAKSQVDC